jgi:N-acetylglutamate synthase-like GNAT family acetyltransferase
MLVRRFEPKDAMRLSQLIIENLQQVNINDYSQETIDILAQAYIPDRIIERARQHLTLVGLVEDEVVGTASLDHDRVRNVFVEVSRHKRGLGKKLMAVIEAYAKEQHLEKIFLLSGLSAYRFYEKLGYKIVKRFDQDLGGMPFPVIQMEKELVAD